MKVSNGLCEFLKWDTDFFGFRIGRVNSQKLDLNVIESIYAWSESNSIECLYFQADAGDPQTIRLAEDNGFRIVEIRLIMERSLRDWNPKTRAKASEAIQIRQVQTGDLPAVQQIAKSSYVDSRYYFDACFPIEKWQAYYATWVKKSCEGGADLVLIAEQESEVIGFITGLVNKEKMEGHYELTGVKESARRSGIGQELFRSGLDWYVRAGVKNVWLATQGRNVATQRMVQRNGFITKSCLMYYHKWFHPCSAKEYDDRV